MNKSYQSKKIRQRTVNDKTYELCFIPQPPVVGEPYVIYSQEKWAEFDRWLEVASFDNEKEAIEYLEKI